MSIKIQKSLTGMTAVSQHIVITIDYICGFLLIHYMCNNTNMSELA